MSSVKVNHDPEEHGPVFLFLFTNSIFLAAIAALWLLFWIGFSAKQNDWAWLARSGSVLSIIGGILTSRPILRLTRAERIRIRHMTLVECFTPAELEEQERDSTAIIIGVFLLVSGTLIWAYGDLLPRI